MDTYDSTMLPRFRALLAERAAQLARVIGHDADALHEAPAEVDDFKDTAARDSIAQVDEAQSAQAVAELQQVQAALRRMAQGTYGLCVDCDSEIDLRRLVAIPHAALCADCQARHEPHPSGPR